MPWLVISIFYTFLYRDQRKQKQVDFHLIFSIIKLLGNVKEYSNNPCSLLDIKHMNSITKITTIGIPAIIGIGVAWVGNRILRNEKELKNRELELKVQLSAKPSQSFY